MKATFVGGGSHRLLGILRSAMGEPGVLDGGEICLYDLNPARIEAMAAMLRKTPEYTRAACRVTVAKTLAKALDGADMVGVILMAGSAESYAAGGDACYRHGFVPSDNVSPNGAFLAIKGAPILLNIAKEMKKRCPQAMLVDFANPVAVLSGMLNNHTSIQTLGVCAGYTNHQWDAARVLGRDEQRRDIDVEVAGVNHLSFILKGTVGGKDLFKTLQRRAGSDWQPPKLSPTWPAVLQKSIPMGLRVIVRFLHELGVLIFSTEPDGMMHLHFDEVIAEQLRTFKPMTKSQLAKSLKSASDARAEADREFRSHLDRELDADFWANGWRQPGSGWAQRQDGDIFCEVLAGLSGARRVKVVTSRPNHGAIAGFTDRTAVEYSQYIDHGEVTAAGQYEIPPQVYGMITGLANHQTLLGDALAMDDPKLLAQALLCYPIEPCSKKQRSMYRELTAINASQMSPALQRVTEFL